MLQFQYPELFLLAIPFWLALWRWGRAPGVTGWLRAGLVGVLLLACTGPEVNVGGRGLDVIVLADRSRSMPSTAHDNIRELIQNLQRERGPGDRIGVVTFGARAEIEQILSGEAMLDAYMKEVLPDGSDLHDAILQALSLIDPNRPARILALTDGEANGPDPLSAARRAREQEVPIDFRRFERQRLGDVAVESLELPDEVSAGEPFQYQVRIIADQEAPAVVRVRRDGEVLSSEELVLTAGVNSLLRRDVLEAGGFYEYTVDVDVVNDPLLENNRASGVVRVDAGARVLVLNTDGVEGNLVRALRAGRMSVDVGLANAHPLTQDALDPYRAVVLENVPADDLGRQKMERLAQFVEDLGGGLMLTGGERSFGTGGYFRSPLDEVLPVSMEMREEHRHTRVALAIALDRSGSMAAPVRGERTKMDLANLGTAECVRLLSPQDMVSIIAVDTAPHVVQSLTKVEDPESIAGRALSIRSEGGGIFVYQALAAAGQELMKAEGYRTRHIILFSDAADSEEPGEYRELLAEYAAAGITCSVIGLGSRSDADAALLEEIADLGRGNVMFTADAEELPRLFTQDTMSVARSSFVRKTRDQPEGIPGRLLPDARLMGDFGEGVFPRADGYNLSYLKPAATAAVVSQDEYQAPWSAFWYRGVGRVSALTLEVDGPHSGQFGRWGEYEHFLITHVRWLLGGGGLEGVFVEVDRSGQEAVVTVELDPERAPAGGARPTLVIVPPGEEREAPRHLDLAWTGPESLEARFRMERMGTYRTLVQTGERQFARGPAVTLPYSPEYAPRFGQQSGNEILSALAGLTGGKERLDVLETLRDPPRAARNVPLLPWLVTAALILLLLEIAGRRLSLWSRWAEPQPDALGDPAGRRSRKRRWTLDGRRRASLPPPGEVASAPSPSELVFNEAKERARRRLE